MTLSLDSIRAAAARIGGRVHRTPCYESLRLGRLLDARVWLKCEHLQETGSFKERGACNKLLDLDAGERALGVVAASAGNHALGLSFHGRSLGVPVTVVMPRFASILKVRRCRDLGARVILHGDNFDEARERALALAREQRACFVHGFDDLSVMAGQGTVALEMLEQAPDLDAVLVPVGGGGLISGVGVAMRALAPALRVIGVEPEHAATLSAALRSTDGASVEIDLEPTLADGLSVRRAGTECLAIARSVVDKVLLVDEPMIADGIVQLLELEKSVVEGAGAIGIAALKKFPDELRGLRVGVILSGGNIDVSVLSRVIERGMAAQGRLCRIQVPLTDHPGTLAHLLAVLADTGASIKQVDHDRAFGPADVSIVTVRCVLETRDREHIEQIHAALDAHGIRHERA
ncbi:MAG TPA: threonine ammonia-lyase [Polyangiaceae bacterium]